MSTKDRVTSRERGKMLKIYLSSFAETAPDPNKPSLPPWHEHGHAVAVVL